MCFRLGYLTAESRMLVKTDRNIPQCQASFRCVFSTILNVHKRLCVPITLLLGAMSAAVHILCTVFILISQYMMLLV